MKEKVSHFFRRARTAIKTRISRPPNATSTESLEEGNILLRIEAATEMELHRMCVHLKIDKCNDTKKIASEYKSASGNSFVNIARNCKFAGEITYREILIDVFEKIRPVGDDIKAWTDTVTSVFKNTNKDSLHKQRFEPPIEQLESALLEIAMNQINNAIGNISPEEKAECHEKAQAEVEGSSNVLSSTLISISSFAKDNAVTGLSSLFTVAGTRGVFLVAGGSASAAVSAILIPVALSTPAYRKTVNATLEFILIGRRQSAELEVKGK